MITRTQAPLPCALSKRIKLSGAFRTRLQLWSPDRSIGPAALRPFDGRNADWIFSGFRLINIDTQTGPFIWPQVAIMQFWNPRKNLLERIAKEDHFLNAKVVACQI